MSSSGASTKQISLICMGSKILPSFACLLKGLERPEIEGLKWVEDENLFVGFQSFYKKKPGLDISSLAPNLREKIYHEFFPLLVRAGELQFSPSPSKPNALKIKLSIASTKNTEITVHPKLKQLSENVRELLKTTSAVYQSFECDLQITIAHISPRALENPNLKAELEKVRLQGAILEPFYLDKLFIIEVTKTDSGLKYTYKPLLEV